MPAPVGAGVDVGVLVGVLDAIAVGDAVCVDVAMLLGVAVAVAVGVSVGVRVAVSVGVWVGVSRAAKPWTAMTWFVLPKVENRKSPVTGSITAPSAPASPEMKSARLAGFGLPLASIWYVLMMPAWYSDTSMLVPLRKSGDPGGT